MWHLKPNADGTVEGNGFHGGKVTHLRDVPSERHLWFKEQKKVTHGTSPDRLEFYVSTDEVASEGRATGADPRRR